MGRREDADGRRRMEDSSGQGGFDTAEHEQKTE